MKFACISLASTLALCSLSLAPTNRTAADILSIFKGSRA